MQDGFSIYRAERRFPTYGVRPFLLVSAIEHHDANHRRVISGGYLILHGANVFQSTLDALAIRLRGGTDPINHLRNVALEDAIDVLNSDLPDGSEVVTLNNGVREATWEELVSAKVRGAINFTNAPTVPIGYLANALDDLLRVETWGRTPG